MRILVVAAHPDDEILGCGGTLLAHRDAGDEIALLFLTDGVGARGHGAAGSERQHASETVARKLNASVHRCQFRDNQLDSHPLLEIVQAIEKIVNQYHPVRIYTHHHGDLNIDHEICHRAVLTACRPQPNHPVEQIFCFEVNSATEWNTPVAALAFLPSYFVDISSHTVEKRDLLNCYQQELRPFPHSRSPEAIAARDRVRGNSVGLEAAEAFMLVRWIERFPGHRPSFRPYK